jgi:hypothetical protein
MFYEVFFQQFLIQIFTDFSLVVDKIDEIGFESHLIQGSYWTDTNQSQTSWTLLRRHTIQNVI